MKTPLFTGSGVAIVTPFTDNGIDFDKLGELIEWHINNKTDAIIVCGTTGEASTMMHDEHKSAVKYTVDKVAKRVPVIAGTGSNNTAEAIDLSVHAESVGADGLLVVTPYYNKTTQKGLVLHFEQIAEAVTIPIILYNIPGRTGGLAFSIDTLKKLDKLPNINAVKEATGDLAFVAKIAAETDLVIYSGNDDIIVPVMSVGGMGVISVVANILPAETHDMCEKFLNDDTVGSREIFLGMLNLVNSLFVEVNPIPIKTAMNLLGHNVGKLRMPLCDMEDTNLATLKSALEQYGLKV